MINPSAKRPPGAIALQQFPALPLSYGAEGLRFEQVDLSELAGEFGTPLYVYSGPYILSALASYQNALGEDGEVFFAVKACSNIWILRLIQEAGAGADIVSLGELRRAQAAGFTGSQIVFSGVGKTKQEMQAALQADLRFLVIESAAELKMLEEVARVEGRVARISVRVNPDIAADTHPYIATGLGSHKFGVPAAEVLSLYRFASESPHLEPVAIGFHIGSQILSGSAHLAAAERILALADRLRAELDLSVKYLDAGGGLGISYDEKLSPHPASFIESLRPVLRGGLKWIVEPGRSICGNAGVLLTRVLYRKTNGKKDFIICDAAMNDLLRPALYQAEHRILAVREVKEELRADLVGPVCESGDFLARDRLLPAVDSGDLLALLSAGAYGFAMSSNYNSRLRPAEVLIDGPNYRLIRQRETFEDLLGPELRCGPG
ncbi:MAG: diaminopimelate decarboxylase [Spirochaetales bacterium]|nr:diaminopimelate decarboxylase [Spirochaetales bacterium]